MIGSVSFAIKLPDLLDIDPVCVCARVHGYMTNARTCIPSHCHNTASRCSLHAHTHTALTYSRNVMLSSTRTFAAAAQRLAGRYVFVFRGLAIGHGPTCSVLSSDAHASQVSALLDNCHSTCTQTHGTSAESLSRLVFCILAHSCLSTDLSTDRITRRAVSKRANSLLVATGNATDRCNKARIWSV
jgi:hypothetical protein